MRAGQSIPVILILEATAVVAEVLTKALMQLSKTDQLLIYQHHFAEIPTTELAKVYGVSQQAISRRLARIYSRLKIKIE